MQKISYVNGKYMPHNKCYVHIEDRGYQFADGIYEVLSVKDSVILNKEIHFKRLLRSLNELAIKLPINENAINIIIKELMRRNKRQNCTIYLQITRGVAPRRHDFPSHNNSSLVITISNLKKPLDTNLSHGVTVITGPDNRWQRCDIKSIALLANILSKQLASSKGCYETWLFDADNNITEGSSSNSFIVTSDNIIVTHPATNNILGGVTREVIIELALKNNFKLVQRKFSVSEAIKAKEAFLTSTTNGIMPVIKIDDHVIGSGMPGAISQGLRSLYDDYLLSYIKNKIP
jgi:D-alanine transaminase